MTHAAATAPCVQLQGEGLMLAASGMASRGSEVNRRIAHLEQLRRLVGTAECQGGRDRTCSDGSRRRRSFFKVSPTPSSHWNRQMRR